MLSCPQARTGALLKVVQKRRALTAKKRGRCHPTRIRPLSESIDSAVTRPRESAEAIQSPRFSLVAANFCKKQKASPAHKWLATVRSNSIYPRPMSEIRSKMQSIYGAAVTTIRDGKYWRGHVAQGLEIISTQSRGLLYSLKQEVDEMHKKATQRLDALEQKQRLSNLIIKTGSSNEAPPCSSVRFLPSRRPARALASSGSARFYGDGRRLSSLLRGGRL